MDKKHYSKCLLKKKNIDLSLLITEPLLLNYFYNNHFKEVDNIYLIKKEDIKLINFILNYLFKNYKDVQRSINIKYKKSFIIKHKCILKSKLLIKFINFVIINLSILSETININNKDNLNKDIYHLIKYFFLYDIVTLEDIKIILILKIIICLYNEKINLKNKNNNNLNKDNINLKEFYLLIDFLLSFIRNKMNDKKISEFNKVIIFFAENIKTLLFKNNFNFIFILSRNNFFFKLIELCKISDAITSTIIPLLIFVYKNKFDINYIFEDLSEQFILNSNENINSKTNYLMAKNTFLNMLFSQEENQRDEISINNGFVFNNIENNGIVCYTESPESIKFPKDGFSITISFCLMKNNNNNSQKYSIFSFFQKEKNFNMNLFIENNILKLFYNFKKYVLFSDIKINKNYIFWMIFPKERKSYNLFYLNGCKKFLPHMQYSSEDYDEIYIGFNKDLNTNKYIDNFEGIIGTFIFFNKCLIKDKNDNQNESKLIELKGEYEHIINIYNKRDFFFLNRNINLILNKYLLDKNDISQYIEVIISTKSLGIGDINNVNNYDYYINKNNDGFICNYFNYNYLDIENCLKYKFNSEKCLLDNITYPIEFNDSFLQFIKNNGIIYLQTELFYLIGVFSNLLKNNNNIILEEKDINEMNLNLTKILSLFFYCFNSKIYNEDYYQNEINNFFYTLNDIISIYAKYNFKIKSLFLSLIINNLQNLLANNLLMEKCEFIFKFDIYDINDAKIFILLFQGLSAFIEGYEFYNNRNIIKFIFGKMMGFDKIYLNENISKESKKRYTELIQKLIMISLEDKHKIFFNKIYFQRLKQIKEEIKMNIFCSEKENNNSTENYIYGKKSLDDSDRNKENNQNQNYNKNNLTNIIQNKILNLKLLYKYLKNIFIAIDSPIIRDNFIYLCLNNEAKTNSFFNEIFSNMESEFDKNQFINNKKTDLIYPELIKSLCIQLLDQIFFEKNVKEMKEQNLNKNNKKVGNNSQKALEKVNIQKISNDPKSSFVSISSDTLIINNEMNINNNSILEGFRENRTFIGSYNNNTYNNINNAHKKIQEKIYILTKNFEFLNDFIISPYSFLSFYLLLFKNTINNKKILKMIKNYNSSKNNDLILNIKEFDVTKYYIDLILLLIERMIQNKNNFNSLFMDKYEFLEFCFDKYNEMLVNILNYYYKKSSQKKEEILNYLFAYKDKCFFEIAINNLNYLTYSNNNIYINGNEIINPNKDNDKSEFIEAFFKNINDSLKNIINRTIFEIKNPFYFTFLNKIFLSDNKNIDFVLETISFIIDKYIDYEDSIISENSEENTEEKFDKLMIIELNNKNLLFLIYKILFYIPKRNIILKKEDFIKKLYIYLSTFLSFSKLLYIKILFPIEDKIEINEKINNNKNINKKLVIEIVFEILLDLYLEYVIDTKKIHLQIFEDLIYDLLNMKNLANHKFNKTIMEKYSINKKKKKINHTSLYILDKISFKKENEFKITDGIKIKSEILKKIKDYLFNKDKYYEKENIFSICLIFIIKILITIRDLDELLLKINENNFKIIENKKKDKTNEKNINEDENNIQLRKIFISILNQLFQDTFKLYKNYPKFNPLASEGKFNNGLYLHFKNFIIKEYNSNEKFSNMSINNLIKKLSLPENIKYLRNFSRVIFNLDGSIILYTYKNYMKNIRIPIKNEPKLMSFDSNSSNNSNSLNSLNSDINTNSTSNKNLQRNNSFDSNNPKIESTRTQKNISHITIENNINIDLSEYYIINNKFDINEEDDTKIKENNNKKYLKSYIKKIRFKSDILKTYFSSFFLKLLTYDKDFMTIKKIFRYIFNNDLKNLDEFNNFECPLKIKNYIPSNFYMKEFLKKDFYFIDNEYFQYSHKYLFKEPSIKRRDITNKIQTDYKKQSTVLFPSKDILKSNDFPNNDNCKNENNDINYYYCELLINRGSIFGKILIFENGILFLSDFENDKINKNTLEFACCTLDYDSLKEIKKIFILYDEINEIFNRYFCFCWISQEIFLKNGKSYLFNFFNEKNNDEMFELFKSKKIPRVIKYPREIFEKEEFSKKWKEGKISTFEYLLILNKYSSRSYNDTNQYPVMPWIHLLDSSIRNFDLPISLQNEKIKELYLKKFLENIKTPIFHNNHYSTSAYIYFYLMRINPFSNNMIKFQSCDFDIPDRQFITIKGTLELCEKYNNNREIIPEIFDFPEIYYNLNYNDFGKLKDNTRIHNLSSEPYANNGIEYCYKLKYKIDSDLEINQNINKWFDFIFGVNQYKVNPKDNPLRQFNSFSYAQFVNIKKKIVELKKQKIEENKLIEIIKNHIGYAINFGESPFQVLTEPHPLKNENSNLENKENLQDNDISLKIKDKINYKISYFYKNNKNIICLLNNGFLSIYSLKKKSLYEYVLIKEIKPKSLFYHYELNKYCFCELKDDFFIFCGYLDKTLGIYFDKKEIKYLLDSYATSIIKINEIQFVTGHNNGLITKWEINIINNNNQIDLKLDKIQAIKSNNICITCLEYNQKMNIILSSDSIEIILRNYYNLEFLAHIKINKNNCLYKSINLKISNYNLIYVLIEIKKNFLYELHCYTLNGTYVCKKEGNFPDFELTNSGNIIIPDLDNRLIKVLRAYDLFLLHSNSYPFIKNNKNQFHIFYENANNIYLSIEEKGCTQIKKLQVNKNKEIYFN